MGFGFRRGKLFAARMRGTPGSAMGAAVYEVLESRVLLSASAAGQAKALVVSSIGGNISGTVFQDQNNNGVQDAGESPLAGWVIYVDLQNDGEFDYGDPSAVTDASGNYTITGVTPGTYAIRQVVQDGYTQTSPVSFAQQATVVAGQTLTYNFGDYKDSSTGSAFTYNFTETNSAIQPDGKIVAVGYTGTQSVVARYFPDGTLDTSFGTGGEVLQTIGGSTSQANDLLVEPDGNIIVVGDYDKNLSYPGESFGYYERLTPTGQLDPTFQGNDTFGTASNGDFIESTYTGVTMRPNGEILLSGEQWDDDGTQMIAGTSVLSVYDLDDATGTLDTTFGPYGDGSSELIVPGGDLTGVGAASAPDGGIWTAGWVTFNGEPASAAVTHFDSDGIYDNVYAYVQANSTSNNYGEALTVQPNGQSVVAGYTDEGTGSDDFLVFRLNTDGSLDDTFGAAGDGIITTDFNGGADKAQSVEVLPDGDVLVAGTSIQSGVTYAVTALYSSSGILIDQQNLGATTTDTVTISHRPSDRSLLAIPPGGLGNVGTGTASTDTSTENQPSSPPPTASVIYDPAVSTGGASSYLLKVQYTDSQQVDFNDLGPSNILVSGPGGYQQLGEYVGLDPGYTATTVVADYQINPPAGSWQYADNGNYSITLLAGQVGNGEGTFASTASLGTFNVAVPAPAPTATLNSAPPITTASTSPYIFQVEYQDSAGIQTSSISTSNVTVSSSGGSSLTVTSATIESGATANDVVVDYQIAAPAGGWSPSQNNTYQITLQPGQVASAGTPTSYAAGSVLNSFNVDIVPGAPTASLTLAPALSVASSSPYLFKVEYKATNGIAVSSISSANIKVSASGGSALTVTSATVESGGTADDVVVDYQIAPPSGGWTAANDNTYQITLQPNQVATSATPTVYAAAGVLGSFKISITAATDSLSGYVIDGLTGSPEAGVSVTLSPGNISTTTNSQGQYTFAGLSAGTYSVVTSSPAGFATIASSAPLTVSGPTAGPEFYPVPAAASGTEANLICQIITLLPGSLVGGSKGRVVVKVTNNGTSKASGTSSLMLFASTQPSLQAGSTALATVPLTVNLLPGRSKLITVNFHYPSPASLGAYYLLASANASATIPESNYSDNLGVSGTTVQIAPPFVDFTGTFVLAPATVRMTRGGAATLSVQNFGNVASSGQMQIALYATTDGAVDGSATLLGTFQVNGAIPSGKRRVYALRFKVPGGFQAATYTLAAVINSSNSIVESNTTNNTAVAASTSTFE